jgi:molecular chaperone GrpE (heat shock protein)
MNRTSIIENMIPETDSIAQLILEKQTRDERGQSAEQATVSNNYHNIFFLDKQLMNTSQEYLSRIQATVEQFGWSFENPIVTIQNIFKTISENFISAFLTIIDDRNNMLDRTRDLILNYELYHANNMAATNTIISGVVNILRVVENNEWISTNMFRILEVNFRGLYHDLASLYRDVTGNHVIISR